MDADTIIYFEIDKVTKGKTVNGWSKYFGVTRQSLLKHCIEDSDGGIKWAMQRSSYNTTKDFERPEKCKTCGKYVKCLDKLVFDERIFPILSGRDCYEKEEEIEVRLKSGGYLPSINRVYTGNLFY